MAHTLTFRFASNRPRSIDLDGVELAVRQSPRSGNTLGRWPVPNALGFGPERAHEVDGMQSVLFDELFVCAVLGRPVRVSQLPGPAAPENKWRRLKKHFRGGCVELLSSSASPGERTIELKLDDVRFDPPSARRKYMARLRVEEEPLEREQLEIGRLVLQRLGNRPEGEAVRVDILPTEGAVTRFVLDRVFERLMESSQDPSQCEFRDVHLRLFLSSWSGAEYDWAIGQLRRTVELLKTCLGNDEPDAEVMDRMDVAGIELTVVEHRLPPFLHGFQVGSSWLAAGIADWKVRGDLGLQMQCRDTHAPFVPAERGTPQTDGLFESFENWTRNAERSGTILGSSSRAGAGRLISKLADWSRRARPDSRRRQRESALEQRGDTGGGRQLGGATA